MTGLGRGNAGGNRAARLCKDAQRHDVISGGMALALHCCPLAPLFREDQIGQIDAVEGSKIASKHTSPFLANMSLDLCTPLHAILGYTKLIPHDFEGRCPSSLRPWRVFWG